jgi:hypothetical protein
MSSICVVLVLICPFHLRLPPLAFSVLNELQMSMRIGLFSLNFFFGISFFLLFLVGDHAEAVEHAKAIDESNARFTSATDVTKALDVMDEFQDDSEESCYITLN